MSRVFISYSRKDLYFVTTLAADLKNEGLDVWYDVSELSGGARWRTEIEKALQNSQFVIIVLSPDSVESEWVEREFLYSSNLQLKIIPVMYRPCKLPLNYVNLNYIDVQGGNYIRNFGKLLDALSTESATVRSSTRYPASRRRRTYVAWISGATVLAVLLLSLPSIKNALLPPATSTVTATITSTDSPTVQVPSKTPLATSTAIVTWQQGKIAYVARNTQKVYFLYMQELSDDAQAQLLLAPDNPTSTRFYAPWFAPDGQHLLFYDLYTGKASVIDVNRVDDIVLLGKCASPSFSPDSKRAVCDTSEANYFRVYDVKTGNNVGTIQHGKDSAVLPAWSPDGEEIAFSVLDENRDTTIWKVNAAGGNPMLLASGASENYAPAWSPDGEWIAYQSTQTSEKSEVWIMRRDGSDKKQITFSGGGDAWSRGPCFSPDGKWLAFVSNQNESDGADFGDVFIVSLLTGEAQQVTDTSGHVLDWRVTWAK